VCVRERERKRKRFLGLVMFSCHITFERVCLSLTFEREYVCVCERERERESFLGLVILSSGVATISRLLKIIGLICIISSLL